MADLKMWEKRWHSLCEHLEALESYIQELQNPRKHTLKTLVKGLKDFSRSHFYFFYNGFQEGALSISDRFPPEYVLRQVIYRVSDDVRVIQQLVDHCYAYSGNAKVQTVLEQADRLAYAALRPAIAEGIIHEKTTALTYFQKIGSIRVIPYASVAIIGIPLTSIAARRDFLSIPHEVGHYIYQNGIAPSRTGLRTNLTGRLFREVINDRLKYEKRWLKNWMEEIFADVYGALIAGEAIAKSFQDLEIETSIEEFLNDDGDHPTPLVRPEIYAQVLAKRGSPEVADRLRKEWLRMSDARPGPLPSYLVMKSGSGKADIEEVHAVQHKLHGCIDDMLDYLPGKRADNGGTAIWSAMYDNDQAAELPAAPSEAPITRSHVNWAGERGIQLDTTGSMMRVAEWLDVLNAEGWTTQGPHSRPGPGSGP